MAKPRTPRAKAAVEGRDKQHPERFRNRVEPTVDQPLGDPPDWMTDSEASMARSAWILTARDVPWLNASHRGIMEIAASIRGRLMAGQEVGVQALNLLRQLYGQMGATPADASKVVIPDGKEKDPDDEIFGPANAGA